MPARRSTAIRGAPGEVVAQLHGAVRGLVPTLHEDRPPADDLTAVLPVITRGDAAALLHADLD